MVSELGVVSRELSLRLNLLRFPLIVCVVFVHAYSSNVVLAGRSVGAISDSYIADFIRSFLSNGVARVAVPMFFLISGYLFFVGCSLSTNVYVNKLKSRARSLLIPFLFWNLTTLFLVSLAQVLPSTKGFFSGNNALISAYGAVDYFNAIFGVGRAPVAYQFWFIRDLMVMVVFSPLFYFFNKKARFVLVLLFLGWFLDFQLLNFPSLEAVFFFGLGCYLSAVGDGVLAVDRYKWFFFISYLFFLFADVLSAGFYVQLFFHKLQIVFGVLVFFAVTKSVVKSSALVARLLWLSQSSFFVFAAHEPLLTVLKKILYKCIDPASTLSVVGIYFFAPIATIVMLIFLYFFCVRAFPFFTGVITGGR